MASYLQMKPELAEDGTMSSMVIRIIGFVNTQEEPKKGACFPKLKTYLTRVCDYEMRVSSKTNMRDIKNFAMARLSSLRYYQLSLEFMTRNPKDSCTMKGLIKRFPEFMIVRCLHLNIVFPDDMFKAMYKTFLDMGIYEEKALSQTKSFLNTYQNKNTDYEYDIYLRVEKCREKLLSHGVDIKNPTFIFCE